MTRITIFLMLLLPTFATAGECGVRRIVVPTPIYNYRYIAPVKHYDYHYQEKVILVPKAIQVEVQRDHYYSIDSSAQQNLLADAIVGRLLRLQQSGGLPSKPADTVVRPSPTGKNDDSAAQERAGTYQNAALLKVVSDSCAKCHGPSSKFTKFVTTDAKLTDLPAGKVWEAFGLVNTGEMPKASKALPDDQVKLFYDWAKNARK